MSQSGVGRVNGVRPGKRQHKQSHKVRQVHGATDTHRKSCVKEVNQRLRICGFPENEAHGCHEIDEALVSPRQYRHKEWENEKTGDIGNLSRKPVVKHWFQDEIVEYEQT